MSHWRLTIKDHFNIYNYKINQKRPEGPAEQEEGDLQVEGYLEMRVNINFSIRGQNNKIQDSERAMQFNCAVQE